MMKCLLLINTSSGNAQKAIGNKELIDTLVKAYGSVDEMRITENDRAFDIAAACRGYDAVAVCGGDGTFNSTVNALRGVDVELVYIPCGTFNDAAHTLKSISEGELDDLAARRIRRVDLGEINGRLFTYVAAAGSFTAIGFLPKSKYKKLFKRFVYYLYAFKEYRLHRIQAEIDAKGTTRKGTYTLIMALKSKYVFGFNFNKLYRHNSGKGHLLLIKTPVGACKLVKMFFLFFRAFFVGFNKEHDGKYIEFLEIDKAEIKIASPCDFCVDGEKFCVKDTVSVHFHQKATGILIP